MATKVYIVYYSMYGHVEKLAEEIKKGAESVEGVEAKLWQVPETLPEEVLGKMYAPPKTDVPVISASELAEEDGLLFGFPTRFGMMAAQFKAFLDSTGGLWKTQALAGKPAGIFLSTGTQGGGQELCYLDPSFLPKYPCPILGSSDMGVGMGVAVLHYILSKILNFAAPDPRILTRTRSFLPSPGNIGQETTALTAITQLAHHGMLFVPTGCTFGGGMFEMEEIKGGSPYGAGTYAGTTGTRQPTELELGQAFHQGKQLAGIAKKLKGTA